MDVQSTLQYFKESTCDSVSGALLIEGKKPGPTLGITACTHGNEPSGLAVFAYLLEQTKIRDRLECGRLYLIVNNLLAAERSFSVRSDTTLTEKCRKKAIEATRYVD